MIVFRPNMFLCASFFPGFPTFFEFECGREVDGSDVVRPTKGAAVGTARCFELALYSQAREHSDIEHRGKHLLSLGMSLPMEQ